MALHPKLVVEGSNYYYTESKGESVGVVACMWSALQAATVLKRDIINIKFLKKCAQFQYIILVVFYSSKRNCRPMPDQHHRFTEDLSEARIFLQLFLDALIYS